MELMFAWSSMGLATYAIIDGNHYRELEKSIGIEEVQRLKDEEFAIRVGATVVFFILGPISTLLALIMYINSQWKK